ncbi:MAG: CHAT domain-containing protein [Chloroflexia bacterium]
MTTPGQQPTYLNFDLIVQREGEEYIAKAQSPQGEAMTRFAKPFNDLELENFLLSTSPGRGKVRRIDTPEVGAAKRFGERLYASAFGGEVGGLLRSCLSDASQSGTKLRVRLRLTDVPELADLPWEYLYNPALNRFFSLDDDTAIVRYLEMPERVRPVGVQLPLRVLVVISDPNDYAKLDVEQEWINLHEALADLIREGSVTLHLLREATLSSLQQELQRNQFHVFHFIGHGGFDRQNQEGVLILKDEYGKGRMVSGQQLGWLLHNHKTLSLAIINACEGAKGDHNDAFAGTAQSLVQQGIPAVVAMQFEITDDAAKTFARAFYTGIASARPLEIALTETRLAMFSMGHGLEWGTPVLYMRSPDGRVFSVQQRPDFQAGAAGKEAVVQRAAVLDPVSAPSAAQVAAQPEVATRYAMARSDYAAGRWQQALETLKGIQREVGSYRDVDALVADVERRLGVGVPPPPAPASPPPTATSHQGSAAPSTGPIPHVQPPAPQAPVHSPTPVYVPSADTSRPYQQPAQMQPNEPYRPVPPPSVAAYPPKGASPGNRMLIISGAAAALLLLVGAFAYFVMGIGRNDRGSGFVSSEAATVTALAQVADIPATRTLRPRSTSTSVPVVDEEATAEAALAAEETATAQAAAPLPLQPPRISMEEFKQLYDDPATRPVIVDVRAAAAFGDGHIAGAISVPEAEVDGQLDRIPSDQLVVAYCH